MQVAAQAYPLLQRRTPTNRMREHQNNRAHKEVVVARGAAPQDDHRLPKRVMSGEGENAGKRRPGEKEK